MNLQNLFEVNEITLWHGGKDLEHTYSDFLPARKDRWQHGPGIYLSTHYNRAYDYAKGGKKTYLVTIEGGNNISNVLCSKQDMIDFINRYVKTTKRKEMINFLNNKYNQNEINLEILLNLCVNDDALSSKNTIALRKFIIDHGADYGISSFGGKKTEYVVVVYNPKIIKKIQIVKAKDVSSNDKEKDISEFKFRNI